HHVAVRGVGQLAQLGELGAVDPGRHHARQVPVEELARGAHAALDLERDQRADGAVGQAIGLLADQALGVAAAVVDALARLEHHRRDHDRDLARGEAVERLAPHQLGDLELVAEHLHGEPAALGDLALGVDVPQLGQDPHLEPDLLDDVRVAAAPRPRRRRGRGGRVRTLAARRAALVALEPAGAPAAPLLALEPAGAPAASRPALEPARASAAPLLARARVRPRVPLAAGAPGVLPLLGPLGGAAPAPPAVVAAL